MKILVVNCGSSSLKYQLIDMSNERVLAKGKCDKIGFEDSFLKYKCDDKNASFETIVPIRNHSEGIKLVIDTIIDSKVGAVDSINEIAAIGHRVVHGGEKFTASAIINEEILKAIEECNDLAPLHNPANIVGIRACMEVLPKVPMVAVFDTAFHQTMPKEAFLYGLPYEYYTKYGVRKYGFHGTSHRYIAKRASEILGKPLEELNIISCHLGNGSSLCAIKGGKSIDTTMGLTPLEGLMMGTRCGDMDPAIIQFIMNKENKNIDQISGILNKESGLLGISGTTSDVRDLRILRDNGDKQAELALNMFEYRVKKYIGSYIAALGHVDLIAFAGGIGEFNPDVVEHIVAGLDEIGTTYDISKRGIEGQEIFISTANSKIKMMVIPTDEELTIARDTLELIK